MRLLIGFDDSDAGRDALELGLQLSAAGGDPATVVTVYPDDDAVAYPKVGPAIGEAEDTSRVIADHGRLTAERKLDVARAAVGDRADVRFEAVGPSYASKALHEYAEQSEADLLVIGVTEHAAIGRIAPNSTGERLLNDSPCPVAVAPDGYRDRGQRIEEVTVAYDGSPESRHALAVARQAAQRVGASVHLVAVAQHEDDALRDALESARKEFPDVASADLVTGDDVVDVLADLPGRPPQLLVCGSRGRGPLRRVLLGSVSTQLIRKAAYPVVVVPRTAG
ncbi:MAG: universal stress protein [Actinomycetes bacterium]